MKLSVVISHLMSVFGCEDEVTAKEIAQIILDDLGENTLCIVKPKEIGKLSYDNLLTIGYAKYHEICEQCSYLDFVGHFASLIEKGVLQDWPDPNSKFAIEKGKNTLDGQYLVIRYNGGWGNPCEKLLDNPTFTETILAIDGLIRESEDHHHVFLEAMLTKPVEVQFNTKFHVFEVLFGS